MLVEDLILVSVDDHVVEPPNVFEGRLSKKAAAMAPRVEGLEGGRDVWMFEGHALPNVGLNAVAGRVPEEYGLDALSFDQMRPGCYDIHERIRDMNVNGMLGSLNFPSIAGFTGQLFYTCADKEIALELLRAYNDWHVEDWCGTYPGRMIPLSIPPLWDVELMAAEVRRMAEKGCHAVTFSENPEKLGFPSWHSDHWDPFLRACEEVGTVICVHIGSSSETVITAMDPKTALLGLLDPPLGGEAGADLAAARRSNVVQALVHVATDRLPTYPSSRPGDWNGLQSYVDRLEDLTKAWVQSEAGRLPDHLPLYAFTPSAIDTTLAPAGHHTVYLACPATPSTVDGGWPARREEFVERCLDTVEGRDPGFRASVRGVAAWTPDEMERVERWPGGHPMYLDIALDQLGPFRPTKRLGGWRTPIAGLYISGAGTNPSGGIAGTPGRQAARTLLADHA